MKEYKDVSRKGLNAKLPKIESFPSHFRNYEIKIEVPEFTSVCPKTGLPDFGIITVRYVPNRSCIELKSFKNYILAYRNLGIFYENAVNRMLKDITASIKPKWVEVTGKFNTRGGMNAEVKSCYGKCPKSY